LVCSHLGPGPPFHISVPLSFQARLIGLVYSVYISYSNMYITCKTVFIYLLTVDWLRQMTDPSSRQRRRPTTTKSVKQ
jgi:hypothetical protein